MTRDEQPSPYKTERTIVLSKQSLEKQHYEADKVTGESLVFTANGKSDKL